MSVKDYQRETDRFKRMLGTSETSGWVFAVCPAVAKRAGFELWCVRLTAIILLLLFTVPTVVVYFVAAMVIPETRPGAQNKLKRWAKRADSIVDGLKDSICSRSRHQA